MTDHISIIFKCEFSSNNRGKDYWKLNTSVLFEPKYCDIINSFLTNLPDEMNLEENSKNRWELIKL